jgi:hypothetical protein
MGDWLFGYLTTLLTEEVMQCQVKREDNESKMIWKEAVMAYFKVIFQHSFGENEGN